MTYDPIPHPCLYCGSLTDDQYCSVKCIRSAYMKSRKDTRTKSDTYIEILRIMSRRSISDDPVSETVHLSSDDDPADPDTIKKARAAARYLDAICTKARISLDDQEAHRDQLQTCVMRLDETGGSS